MLVTIDTLRADHVGAYGREPSPTPTLDAIAAAGTRFDHAFAPTPLTLPSHATLMTGLDPHEHGVRDDDVFQLAEDVPTLAEALSGRGWQTAAFVGASVLDRSFGLARGFDVYDDRMTSGPASPAAGEVPERRADLVADEAVAWLRDAPERFFLWVHFYDPHAAYRPPRSYRTRFEHPYEAEIAFTDAQISRLREIVDARWPEGRTLFVVTSDHGESLGEHGEETHAYSLYDATQRVPLLVSGAGTAPGRVVDSVVALRDVAPTLAEIAGARALRGASGRNLRPLLVAGEAPRPVAERAAYLETVAPQLDWGWSPLLGLRTATHKYVRAPRPELYDLIEDPGETVDLAASEPELAAELDARLESHLSMARRPSAPSPLDAEARARLEALGDLSRVEGPTAAEIGRVGGTNPKDELPLVAELQRASRLLGEQEFGEAFAIVETLGDRGLEVSLLQANAAIGVGRLDPGLAAARRVTALAPRRARGWVLLGRIAELRNDLTEAEQHYRHAASLGTGTGSPATGLGRIAEARGDPEGAKLHYRSALEARFPEPEARWRLAALLIEDRQLAAARAQLAATPTPHVRRGDAAARLAQAYQNIGDVKEANNRLLQALFRQPDSIRVLRTQAEILDAQGHPDASLAALEKAFGVAPDHPGVRNELAWALARRGIELERAERLARSTVVAAPDDPGAIDTLCAVLLARGEAEEALELADAAVAEASGTPRAFLHYRRAEALHRLGRTREAEAALDAARSAPVEAHAPYLPALASRVGALVEGSAAGG